MPRDPTTLEIHETTIFSGERIIHLRHDLPVISGPGGGTNFRIFR